MQEDPIVSEIHTAREKIATECQYDIQKIMQRLKKNEQKNSDRVIQNKTSIHTPKS